MGVVLPGTEFEVKTFSENIVSETFETMFACGGLTLSQVSLLTGLEPYVIQNWVKRGFLSSPVKKKYSKNQFSRIAIINMLRESLQMDKICTLISYINGSMNDESDDLVEDAVLYNVYCNVLALTDGKELTNEVLSEVTGKLSDSISDDYTTRRRMKRVLTVMALAHRAQELCKRAEIIMGELD